MVWTQVGVSIHKTSLSILYHHAKISSTVIASLMLLIKDIFTITKSVIESNIHIDSE